MKGDAMDQDELRLDAAVESMRGDVGEAALTAAAGRLAEKLGLGNEAGMSTMKSVAIESCEDVQSLLADYRAGKLSPAQALLIDGHLGECGACLRLSRAEAGTGSKVVDWYRPELMKSKKKLAPERARWISGVGLAACLLLGVGGFFGYRAWWQVPPGVRAEVISIDGSAYRISDAGDRVLAPGDSLAEGEQVRTSGGGHAVLRLSDGSTVEMNERSVLGVGARGHNMTVALDNGAVIVQAAKRTSGHLYVKTPDCRVAVTGTVFSVNSGIKGSRVAVLQGAVDVDHAGAEAHVLAGDSMTTNENLAKAPVGEQIAWSHDRDKYLPLLAQFSVLQQKIEAIPFPRPRYTSDLLTRVPANTMLYVSIPNLGDFLSQANTIFQDQLKQSPVLQQWWASGDGHGGNGHNTAELDALVNKVHEGSQYLGEEVVVVGMKEGDRPAFAITADLVKSGFGEFLKSQMPASNGGPGLVVLDEASLKTASLTGQSGNTAYALIREHEVVFSNSLAMLQQMDAQLNVASSGFATGDFGKQISAAYGRGAGVILAADLHSMVMEHAKQMDASGQTGDRRNQAFANSGLDGVEYLIAEHRELNGTPENHLNVQFSGTRQKVASWLAAPASMGSLQFVTPNASVAVTVLSKDPKAIADDILAMTAMKNAYGDPGTAESRGDWKGADDQKTAMLTAFRDEIIGNLGGEFLVSLDGPVLPTPAWKAVIEVKDGEALEQTMESLSKAIREQAHGKYTMGFEIVPTQEGDQHYYAIRNLSNGLTIAQYTFSDGYMIVAGDHAVLTQAIHAHDSGDSLARSGSFKALLPHDENDNYSAIAYQNLSPVVGPLLAQMSGQQADALKQLAADARPTAICAWGKDSRIEAASDSHLLGFDFLALGSLLGKDGMGGNKAAATSVRE